ncbi:hypothetical protein PENTCL1PPCAC_15427, partial [Pristionchus entomophagus]
MVLAFLTSIVLIFRILTVELHLFFPSGANATLYFPHLEPVFVHPDSPLFLHHRIATSTEWALVFLIFSYYLTVVDEFRKSSLSMPSINFEADYLQQIENEYRK